MFNCTLNSIAYFLDEHIASALFYLIVLDSTADNLMRWDERLNMEGH